MRMARQKTQQTHYTSQTKGNIWTPRTNSTYCTLINKTNTRKITTQLQNSDFWHSTHTKLKNKAPPQKNTPRTGNTLQCRHNITSNYHVSTINKTQNPL